MKYFLLTFCLTLQAIGQDIQSLDAKTFSFALMNNPSAQLIDLRVTKAFEEGHIKKAISIDYENDEFQSLIDSKADKFKTLFIYDQTGKTGKNACLFLKEIGYREVYYLEGGFTNWTSSSKPYVYSKNNSKAIASFTKKDLQNIVSANDKVFLFLHAPYCKQCQIMEPIISRNTGDAYGIKMLKIDASKELTITEYFNAKDKPTMIYFKNGRQVWKYSGEISENDLRYVLFQ
jgi:rhodanese-related sulfurtransferase